MRCISDFCWDPEALYSWLLTVARALGGEHDLDTYIWKLNT